MDLSFIQDAKLAVVELTSLSKDALHVHVGLLVYFAATLLARRRLRSFLPLLAVVLVALLGEAVDYTNETARHGRWDRNDSIRDLVNTTFWPAVLFLVLRFGRR
jgi:cell shape-determining protein MreD